MVDGESEIFLGEVILNAFAIKFENGLDLPEGTGLEFRFFAAEEKKKKGFAKKSDKNMNMRIARNGS